MMREIPALKRIATTAIEIEASAARYENSVSAMMRVVQSFEKVSPSPELVQLIEDPESAIAVEVDSLDRAPVRGVVPIKVESSLRVHDGTQQCGLAALARSGQQNHLLLEIRLQLRGQPSFDH